MGTINHNGHFRIFSQEEVVRLVEEAGRYGLATDRLAWRVLIMLLANYGPRLSEVLMLTWEHVDFEAGEITFPTLKRRKPMTRTLPLFPQVGQALADYRAVLDGPVLFPKLQRASSRILVWKAFQKILKRSGVAPRPVHALRHTVGTKLAPMDLATARDWLGHASITTTDRYIHAVRMREVFGKLEAIV